MEDDLADNSHQKVEHDVNSALRNHGRNDSQFTNGGGHNKKNFKERYESCAPLNTTPLVLTIDFTTVF